MKNSWLVSLCVIVSLLIVNAAFGEDSYYARCNIKVLKGNEVTWVNWQASPFLIPVGTKLKVTRNGEKAAFIREDTGESYKVDLGADGDVYLEKFVTKKPVDIGKFPKDIQSHIQEGIAKVGMTKEQVYMAMGAPSTLQSSRTNDMTYEQIMKSNLWIYSRRRFGKNIGVEFSPATGKVTRTEGIWGKD